MLLISSPDVQVTGRLLLPLSLGINQTEATGSSYTILPLKTPASQWAGLVHAVSPPLLLSRLCYPVNLTLRHTIWCFSKLSVCYLSEQHHVSQLSLDIWQVIHGHSCAVRVWFLKYVWLWSFFINVVARGQAVQLSRHGTVWSTVETIS